MFTFDACRLDKDDEVACFIDQYISYSMLNEKAHPILSSGKRGTTS